MIQRAVFTAFSKKYRTGWRKWPKMYWAIDLHDVIIPGTYSRNNDDRRFYPVAQDVLSWLTSREDMCLILFTSSHEDSIQDIIGWMNPIHFNYVNRNPECESNDLCNFDGKFYFDLLLEDKAGFEGMMDWGEIKEALIVLDEWNNRVGTHAQ